METKTFEVRDSATFIPTLAIRLQPDHPNDRYLLERAGFSPTAIYTLLMRLEGGETHYDPFAWPNRTMSVAHQYIENYFDELDPGAVVDVQFILDETEEPKLSERVTAQY